MIGTYPSPLRLYDRLVMKLVLNTVSTATMALLGRVVSNWMAHVEPADKKFIDRQFWRFVRLEKTGL